jgi:hypothetical protein
MLERKVASLKKGFFDSHPQIWTILVRFGPLDPLWKPKEPLRFHPSS